MSLFDDAANFVRGDQFPVLLAALTAVSALGAVWFALLARDPAAARLRSLAKVTAELRADLSATRRNRSLDDLRQSGFGMMRQAVTTFNLVRGRQLDKITALLSRAGWRSKDALTAYLFAKAFVPLLVAAGSVLFFVTFGAEMRLSPLVTTLILLPGGVAGLLGVDWIITKAGNGRVHRLSRALPDALDLLVICAEAGLSLDTAIKRVGEEMSIAAPDMSDELLLTAAELNFLPDRQKALKNLVTRTDVPKLRALVNSLIQSERFGTPLANSLRVLSTEFRDERMVAAEDKAAKLPAIMTVPMILFILPSLFMIILGPAVIHIMDAMK